jgi:chaperonin cofactor prefoldin
MDLSKVLEQLRKELEHLDAAIQSLERLQAKVKRGRPPKMLTALRKARTTPQPPARRQRRRGPAE